MTRALMFCSMLHPIIGTLYRRSSRVRLEKMCTSKSLPLPASPRAARWWKPPGSMNALCKWAIRRAVRPTRRRGLNTSAQANWGTSGSSAKAAAAQAKYLSKLQKKARQHSGAGQPTGGTTATQAGQPLDALGQPAGGPAQAPPSARALRRRPSLGAASALGYWFVEVGIPALQEVRDYGVRLCLRGLRSRCCCGPSRSGQHAAKESTARCICVRHSVLVRIISPLIGIP